MSTAIGLISVPSSMNGPSTAAASVAAISTSPKSIAANGDVDLVTSTGWPNSTLPVEFGVHAARQGFGAGLDHAVGAGGAADIAGRAATDRDPRGLSCTARAAGRAAGLARRNADDRGADEDRRDGDRDRAIVSEAGDQGASVLGGAVALATTGVSTTTAAARCSRMGPSRDAATTERIP